MIPLSVKDRAPEMVSSSLAAPKWSELVWSPGPAGTPFLQYHTDGCGGHALDHVLFGPPGCVRTTLGTWTPVPGAGKDTLDEHLADLYRALAYAMEKSGRKRLPAVFVQGSPGQEYLPLEDYEARQRAAGIVLRWITWAGWMAVAVTVLLGLCSWLKP